MKTRIFATVLVAGISAGANAQTCTQNPADALANEKAKALLCYLSTHTYISGQTDMPDANDIKTMTGRFPAIVAFDFYSVTDGNATANASNLQAAIDFNKNRNGIVAFQWHWKAPIPTGRKEYYTTWDFVSAMNDANSQLYKDVDLVAGELKKLSDAGIPVLFRPLHECNNDFMWWTKSGPAPYKKLWKILYDKFTGFGAHNLVWVFNGMASGQNGKPTPDMKDWYPGDNMVDVVSSDYYQSVSDYDLMKKIGANKTLGVSETWLALNPASDPPFSFSVVWASRDWAKSGPGTQGVKDAWSTAMKNTKTISIDQVPLMVPSKNPKIVATPADQRISNSMSTINGVVDLATIFQDTSKLTYAVGVSGGSSVGAKLTGSKVDLAVKTGDTGTGTITVTATNSLKLSSSTTFKVFLKDYHKGNLALHQPAVASSNDTYGAGASGAFDGDATTRWSSLYTDVEWLTVDLDSVLAVDSASITWEAAYASSYEIQVSTDSVTWSTVFAQPAGAGGTESISFPTTNARFVRMKGGTRSTKYGYSIFEMQVFGPATTVGIAGRSIGGRAAMKIRRTAGAMMLDLRAQGAYALQVRDPQGGLVLSERGAGFASIPMSALRAGMYQATMQDAAGRHVERFLIVK